MHQVASSSPKIVPGLSRHKFFYLFVYLLLALIVYPFVQEGTHRDFVLRVIGGLGILLTVYAISLRRRLLLLGILLAIPAVLQRVLAVRGDAGALSMLAMVLSFAFDPSSW